MKNLIMLFLGVFLFSSTLFADNINLSKSSDSLTVKIESRVDVKQFSKQEKEIYNGFNEDLKNFLKSTTNLNDTKSILVMELLNKESAYQKDSTIIQYTCKDTNITKENLIKGIRLSTFFNFLGIVISLLVLIFGIRIIISNSKNYELDIGSQVLVFIIILLLSLSSIFYLPDILNTIFNTKYIIFKEILNLYK